MFKELKKGKNSEVEKEISASWQKMNILEMTINNRKYSPYACKIIKGRIL